MGVEDTMGKEYQFIKVYTLKENSLSFDEFKL